MLIINADKWRGGVISGGGANTGARINGGGSATSGVGLAAWRLWRRHGVAHLLAAHGQAWRGSQRRRSQSSGGKWYYCVCGVMASYLMAAA